MAAAGERTAERDRRERVARLAERRDEEPPSPVPTVPALAAGRRRVPAARQSDSASARIICERPSAVGAIGVAIRVPTPASR